MQSNTNTHVYKQKQTRMHTEKKCHRHAKTTSRVYETTNTHENITSPTDEKQIHLPAKKKKKHTHQQQHVGEQPHTHTKTTQHT